jgi:hypothetical protein
MNLLPVLQIQDIPRMGDLEDPGIPKGPSDFHAQRSSSEISACAPSLTGAPQVPTPGDT